MEVRADGYAGLLSACPDVVQRLADPGRRGAYPWTVSETNALFALLVCGVHMGFEWNDRLTKRGRYLRNYTAQLAASLVHISALVTEYSSGTRPSVGVGLALENLEAHGPSLEVAMAWQRERGNEMREWRRRFSPFAYALADDLLSLSRHADANNPGGYPAVREAEVHRRAAWLLAHCLTLGAWESHPGP